MSDDAKAYHDEQRAIIIALLKKGMKSHVQDLTKTTGTLPSTRVPAATPTTKGGVKISDADPADLGSADPGTATDVSRSDHVHAHGDLGGGSLHDVATASVAGFMSAADKAKEDLYPAISGLTPGDVLTALTGSTVGFAPPASGSGTVTSVGITAPSEITITNSPVTSSGDIALAWAVQTPHTVFKANPSILGFPPEFAPLSAADIPDLSATYQILDGDLTALAGLSSTGLAARTASNTWAQRTITGTSNRVSVTNGNGVSGNPTLDIDTAYVGQTSLTTLGTIGTGTWAATAIDAAHGGTGQSSYAVGDLIYASGSAALSKLAGVATGNALISGGVTTAPSWGKIGLATHVSGVLPVANGGTGVGAIPVFSVHKNGTTQPIAGSGAFVKLTWSTEEFDSHNDFASDKFTPTIAGTYMLCSSVGVNSLITRMVVSIYKNGVEHKRIADFASSLGGSGAAMVQANGSTDFFEVYVLNSAAVTVGGAAVATNFTGAWVGA